MENEHDFLNDFKIVLEAVKTLETKLGKNEQALLLAFSHLYKRIDEIENNNDLEKQFEDKLQTLENKLSELEAQIEEIKRPAQEKELSIEETKNKKTKRHRPWHYFLSKGIKYKQLLKAKRQLENEIVERQIEEQRIKEEQRKQKEKELQERLEKKRKEEQIERERRKQESQKTIESILKNIYNK